MEVWNIRKQIAGIGRRVALRDVVMPRKAGTDHRECGWEKRDEARGGRRTEDGGRGRELSITAISTTSM